MNFVLSMLFFSVSNAFLENDFNTFYSSTNSVRCLIEAAMKAAFLQAIAICWLLSSPKCAFFTQRNHHAFRFYAYLLELLTKSLAEKGGIDVSLEDGVDVGCDEACEGYYGWEGDTRIG